jgi:hypothetical protein
LASAVLEHVAGSRRLAVDEERLRRVRIAREQALDLFPLARDDLADGIAVSRVSDRRLERLREGARPVLRQQLIPAVHDAWHADRELAAQRNALNAAPLELVEGRRRRRASAGIESVDLGGPSPEKIAIGEQVAARAVHRGLRRPRGRPRR